MKPFTWLVAAVAAERLVELRRSKRHTRALVAAGQRVYPERNYAAMVAVHAGVLIASLAEARRRRFRPAVGAPALVAFTGATALRWWAIRTLGQAWTVRVVAGPGKRLVTGGPYRYLRHPNYAGVALEVVALPLVHLAYVTALVFGLADLEVLRRRIRLEEKTLRA